MGELSNLPNIGSIVEQQLNEVGIKSVDELKQIGSKQAWLKIKTIDDSACVNRLYALEGAIKGIKKTLLSAEEKSDLKSFCNLHK